MWLKVSREMISLRLFSREFHVNSHVNVKCEISHHEPWAQAAKASAVETYRVCLVSRTNESNMVFAKTLNVRRRLGRYKPIMLNAAAATSKAAAISLNAARGERRRKNFKPDFSSETLTPPYVDLPRSVRRSFHDPLGYHTYTHDGDLIACARAPAGN